MNNYDFQFTPPTYDNDKEIFEMNEHSIILTS